ncbi:MAG: rhomboid family intramembrane serine protease [Candidatus Bathyarchaeota archaeon]|nr:rhomboid family intramembrane serine protease [Candidatus Bathyarchaeota archaeon]
MYRGSKKVMLTYIIIALNIIVYAYTAILSGNFIEIDHYVVRQYGQHNSFVLNGGYWQLFTAMFVHVNMVHLLGNMFFLLIFGLRAEELFAIQEYFLIYFSTGLAGNLLTLLFDPSMVSAGASGAIFGLFGACTIYIRRAIGQSIIGALLYSFFLLMMSSGQNVNYLAHLGGLVIGLIIGYALATTRKPKVAYEYKYSLST